MAYQQLPAECQDAREKDLFLPRSDCNNGKQRREKKTLECGQNKIMQAVVLTLLTTNTLLLALLWYRAPTSAGLESLNAGFTGPDRKTMKYGEDEKYMSLDHKYDELWSSEASPTNGIIRINPTEESAPTWGAIGMFHQLHCLTGIRAALQRAREGVDIGMDPKDDAHWPHCLHYMRQAILCSADPTIELPSLWMYEHLPNGSLTRSRGGSIDGVSDWRTCRDSNALYDLRGQHGYHVEQNVLKANGNVTSA